MSNSYLFRNLDSLPLKIKKNVGQKKLRLKAFPLFSCNPLVSYHTVSRVISESCQKYS